MHLKAYTVKLIRSEDVENGFTKGSTVWLHSPVEGVEDQFYFLTHLKASEGAPLYIGQVERRADWDGEWTPPPEEDAPVESVPVKSEPEPLPVYPNPVEPMQTVAPPVVAPPNPAVAAAVAQANSRGGGLKFDGGKPRPSLLINGMPRALSRVIDVLTFGAQKYEAHSWQLVENGEERYDDAKLRHMLKQAMGETHDDESGIEHLAHEICNSLFLLEKLLRKKEGLN
ncbi:hypothetical protein CPT_Pepon027 [Stenotrophomonas phage Pepon]|uniref:dATP/dGTP diphosphohydrolase N-terminal domain-containing protein n=1 Tax=Stenotrophomonas phage Pepon TaxID=2859654 RepID=A0AAE8BI73_9CAUD|nr:hypothetical protein CPT_Pepon027 [Stenotrophomonas phage Pepon]